MPTPKMTLEMMQEAVDAYLQHGKVKSYAAKALGVDHSTFAHRFKKAEEAGLLTDPAVKDAMRHVGTGIVPNGMWIKTKPTDDAPGYSVYLRPEAFADDIRSIIRDTWDEIRDSAPKSCPPRPDVSGDHLLRIGLADVHVGKLCIEAETGFRYDRDIAVHRMIEGTKALLKKARPHGVSRILLPIGNDALHIDNPRAQTTSGTYQDTHGSVRQMYSAAQAGYIKVIELCAEVAPVDLMYVPSNHDWVMGWALAGSIATWFRHDPRVTATEYSLSERHRKYYRYGRNILGETHGDGAKEADLYPLMMTEARAHVSECQHRYWYVAHTHHKFRRVQGVTPGKREKDHIGMTLVNARPPEVEGDNIMIETVRSPSAPDGWHDRNGYVNRQAVECYLHHADDGQVGRFTEWF